MHSQPRARPNRGYHFNNQPSTTCVDQALTHLATSLCSCIPQVQTAAVVLTQLDAVLGQEGDISEAAAQQLDVLTTVAHVAAGHDGGSSDRGSAGGSGSGSGDGRGEDVELAAALLDKYDISSKLAGLMKEACWSVLMGGLHGILVVGHIQYLPFLSSTMLQSQPREGTMLHQKRAHSSVRGPYSVLTKLSFIMAMSSDSTVITPLHAAA